MVAKVILEVIAGPIQGEIYTFAEHDTLIFGRDEDCHARLSEDDMTASRHHFLLEANPPAARLRDLGSLNGTKVNGIKQGGRPHGMPAEEASKLNHPAIDLKHGDEIKVGTTVFKVFVQIPATCVLCGATMPDELKRINQLANGSYACGECLEKADTQEFTTRLAGAMRCSKCGLDVFREVENNSRGDYVCKACQALAKRIPETVLEIMFGQTTTQPQQNSGQIADYEIGRELGRGGMGAVYMARRKSDGVEVALKVMLANVVVSDYARETFQREIEVTRSLRHQNLVEFLAHGSAGSGFYCVLEYCPGGSVFDLMTERGTSLTLAEAGQIVSQALAGLAYAHQQGFVHRDLKPQNILLTAKSGGTAKVADFGLAKNFQKAGLSGMTVTGDVAGTFTFMPREQLVDFKYCKPVSDVWSAGATLYFMLTSTTPRDLPADRTKAAAAILHGPIVPIHQRVASIPDGIARVIDRALANDTRIRYQTAAEFRAALVKVL